MNTVAVAALQKLRLKIGSVYVFTNRDGEQMENQGDWFDEVLKDAKLPGYTWHINRPTFASRLVTAGVNLRTVAELQGHSTFQMTMRYAHLAPEHSANAVEMLCAPKVGNPPDTKTDNSNSASARMAVSN